MRNTLRRGRTRLVGLVAVVVLAAVVVGAVALLGGALQEQDQAGLDVAEAGAETASREGGEHGGWSDGAGPVALPDGSVTVNGFPVGFPPTDLGSVAAAVSLARVQIGFDYETASRAARAYGDGDPDSLVARSQQAVAERRNALGVPVRGPAPAPASFALTPYAFRVTPISPGRDQVDVLSLISSTTTRGAVTVQRYVGTQVVAWSDTSAHPDLNAENDWRVTTPTADDLAHVSDHPALASAGPSATEKLLDLGWTPIAVQGVADGNP